MAAAIILIPEMLSGPDRDSAEKQAQTAAAGDGKGSSEAGIKTYTIDLSQSGAQLPTPVDQPDNRAPPPEETPPPETAAPQQSPEPPAATPAPPVVVAATPAPQPEAKPEPKVEPPKTEPKAVASAPAAPKSAVPTGKGWAVQLASYSSEATAQRIMNEWRDKGQSAFVMPVTTGAKTLYRVRIGPTKDRAASEAVLKTVKGTIPSAAVVAHP